MLVGTKVVRVAESKDCYKSYLPLIPLRDRVPCPSPVAAHHVVAAPAAPVKWHNPEAMLLRLRVGESGG